MKKILCLILALIVCVALVACGGYSKTLPASFDADTVQSAAEDFFALLHEGDYEGLFELFSPELQAQVSAEDLEAAVTPILADKGAFVKFSRTNLLGHTDKESSAEYAICLYTAEFENGKVNYTLSFNSDMTVGGFYLK